jgi:hypothetical protein
VPILVFAGSSGSVWYEGVIDWLARVGELLTALLVTITLLGIVWGLYRKTLGRRRDRYGRLERLGTNAQISFFSSVLGEPPAMRRTEDSAISRYDNEGNPLKEAKTWTECVWIDRDFYVHSVADEDETVHAFSVTARGKRFRPAFRQPGATYVERGRVKRLLRFRDYKLNPKIRLGKTRFDCLGRPEQAASWVGAHNAHYFEAYWGANPGLYQWFVFSINDAGCAAWDAGWTEEMHTFAWGFSEDVTDAQLLLQQTAIRADYAEAQGQDPAAIDGAGLEDEPFGFGEYVEAPLPAFYNAFRQSARINTYTVLGPDLPLDDYPFFTPPPEGYPTIFGPSSVRTRTLAGEQRA